MFASDRDLLVYEPRLFNEVGFAAQRVLDSASGGGLDSNGTTLTVSVARFVDWGVQAGWVAVIADVPAEVVTRFNQTQLYVSKLRDDPSGGAVPIGGSGSGLSVRVATFRPQLAVIHGVILRGLGIEPGIVGPDGVSETSIRNPAALARAECLGALHMIYSAAAVLAGESSLHWAKAKMYAERFDTERRRVGAEIDTDGDGVADAVRRVNVSRLIRG